MEGRQKGRKGREGEEKARGQERRYSGLWKSHQSDPHMGCV